MAHAYHDELGLPTVTVRPFNVYGPGQIGGGAIRAFIEAALAGARPHDPRRRLADPRLVLRRRHGRVRVCAASSSPRRSARASTSATPRSAVTIFDLAQRIKRLTGCPGEIVFQPLHYVDVELRIPNVEKARELLGFEAKVELDDGLARTIAWYRERKPALT